MDAYLWLLPVVFPAVGFFWANCPCCKRSRIVTKYDTEHNEVSRFVPSGNPTEWKTAVDIRYAATVDALFGCGATYNSGATGDRVAVWRCTKDLSEVWVTYQGNEYGNIVYPTSIAVLSDGTSCVAEHDVGGLGSTVTVRYLIHDADGNEVADAAIAGSVKLGLVVTDGTDFFILYGNNAAGLYYVQQIASDGSAITSWSAGVNTSTTVHGFAYTGGDLYLKLPDGIRKLPIGAAGSSVYSYGASQVAAVIPPHYGLHAGSDGNLYFGVLNTSTPSFSIRSITTAGVLRWQQPTTIDVYRITDDGTNLHIMDVHYSEVRLLSDGTLQSTGAGSLSPVLGADPRSAVAVAVDGYIYVTHVHSGE